MNLAAVTRTFRTEEDCLEHLENMRWPDGVRCPTCGNDNICKGTRKSSDKNLRTRFYQCLEPTCKQQFSATSGTMFHRSHLPLSLWFMAINIMMDAKKGISAQQLQQHLGIGSYKTAWYLCHRIRKAMVDPNPEPLQGIIEVDETYLGGRAVRKFRKNPKPRPAKDVVLAMRERDTQKRVGRVRFFHVPDAKLETIKPILEANLQAYPERVITDGAVVYDAIGQTNKPFKKAHRVVDHSKEWVVPGTRQHTNTVESAFSLLKRGIIGSFHFVSVKHLHRYLTEFECRFNMRRTADRFNRTIASMLAVPHMSYRALVSGV